MTQLTLKSVRFKWDEKCEKSFQTLKECLISSPILTFPQNAGTFVLVTDASNFVMGAVLSQIQNAKERVLAYASHNLNKSQQKYYTTKKELLAVVTFLRQFKHYLLGQKILLRTDHASLKWLKIFKEPEGKLARWLSIIEIFDLEIQHRPGSKHQNADSFSSILKKCKSANCPCCNPSNDAPLSPNPEVILASVQRTKPHMDCEQSNCGSVQNILSRTDWKDHIYQMDCEQSNYPFSVFPLVITESNDENIHSHWLGTISEENHKEMQRNNPIIGPFIHYKLNNQNKPSQSEMSGFSRETKILFSQWELFKIQNSLLYRRYYKQNCLQLVAPLQSQCEFF